MSSGLTLYINDRFRNRKVEFFNKFRLQLKHDSIASTFSFIFYFSMLDFGVLAGLERDIPHYKGLKDSDEVQKQSDVGWSTFFVLSSAASLLLGVVSFFVFGEWVLSVLLGVYLFTGI